MGVTFIFFIFLIIVAKKPLLPAVATLCYVMGQTRNDQPCQPCHAGNLMNLPHLVNTSIVSPE